jgi:hypothetical protein
MAQRHVNKTQSVRTLMVLIFCCAPLVIIAAVEHATKYPVRPVQQRKTKDLSNV